MSKIQVITYNVLSPTLVDRMNATDDDKDPKNRLTRILYILQGCMLQKERVERVDDYEIIFCLQEVGQQWVGHFTRFFNSHGYDCVMATYGNHFNDYMGVMMAWSRKLIVTDIQLIKPNDYILTKEDEEKEKEREHDEKQQELRESRQGMKWKDYLHRFVGEIMCNKATTPNHVDRVNHVEKECGVDTPVDPWATARKKYNTLIIVRFLLAGKFVNVATYHMPCKYRDLDLMAIYTMTALRAIEKNCQRNEVVIFAGDFNSQPDSRQYNMITRQNPVFLSEALLHDRNWHSSSFKYESAYRTVFGQESGTNYNSSGSSGAFSGCLDYIFYRNCTAVEALDNHKDFDHMVKDGKDLDSQPSDHVLLCVLFTL